jgi:hypothetical protein
MFKTSNSRIARENGLALLSLVFKKKFWFLQFKIAKERNNGKWRGKTVF